MQGLGKRIVDADVLLKVAFGIQLKRTALNTLREKHRAQVLADACASDTHTIHAHKHTHTHTHTRIHGSVEDTKLSTNKQHTLSHSSTVNLFE